MVAAVPSPAAPSQSNNPSARRRWSPDGDAHLIFQWVKMEGKSQAWVASALGISQPTVSRILHRYERWQAHAKEREGGRLDPAERLRAQRWLTFERNELILASCLRIANETEGFIDTSKSTILHESSQPSNEIEVRTQHSRIDRTGTTARFLRLAFRINMEQLKLAELDQPPPAPVLSDEELAAEDRQAAADAQELAAARRRSEADIPVGQSDDNLVTRVPPDDALPQGSSLAEQPAGSQPSDPNIPSVSFEATPPVLELRLTPTAPVQTSRVAQQAPHLLNPEPRTLNPSAVNNVHNLHSGNSPTIAATAAQPCSCVPPCTSEQNSHAPCITTQGGPPRASDASPSITRHDIATAATT